MKIGTPPEIIYLEPIDMEPATQLSPLQHRKLTRYFNILDQGAKGYIEEEDIYTINLRMARKKGIKESSPEWIAIRENVDLIWKYAREYGVSGDPDKVFLVDWLAHEEYILTRESFLETYVRKITRDVFTLFMHPGDHCLYLEQYHHLISSFGVEEGLIEWAFKHLVQNTNGHLTEQEFVDRVMEFHLSQDRHAPGNYLFGPF